MVQLSETAARIRSAKSSDSIDVIGFTFAAQRFIRAGPGSDTSNGSLAIIWWHLALPRRRLACFAVESGVVDGQRVCADQRSRPDRSNALPIGHSTSGPSVNRRHDRPAAYGPTCSAGLFVSGQRRWLCIERMLGRRPPAGPDLLVRSSLRSPEESLRLTAGDGQSGSQHWLACLAPAQDGVWRSAKLWTEAVFWWIFENRWNDNNADSLLRT